MTEYYDSALLWFDVNVVNLRVEGVWRVILCSKFGRYFLVFSFTWPRWGRARPKLSSIEIKIHIVCGLAASNKRNWHWIVCRHAVFLSLWSERDDLLNYQLFAVVAAASAFVTRAVICALQWIIQVDCQQFSRIESRNKIDLACEFVVFLASWRISATILKHWNID